MNRIVLTTEDIFEKDGMRIKILTNGINLTERFNDNPVILLEHNPEKVLGKWTSIEVIDNKITAIPQFDDDDDSVKIANKIKKGSIKSASIGIEVDEAFLEGDVLIVSKSTLFEASIVAIPANKNAKVISLSKDKVLFLSKEGKVDIDKLINELNMTEEVTPKEEVTTPELVIPESLEVKEELVEEVVTEVPQVIEEIKIVEEVKVDLQLSKELEELKKQVTDLATKLSESQKEVESYKLEKIERLLNSAISEGKITNESKKSYLGLSYDVVDNILKGITPSTIKLSNVLTQSNKPSDVKTYDWYIKNDREGLRKLSKENPSLYKQIELAYINKSK